MDLHSTSSRRRRQGERIHQSWCRCFFLLGIASLFLAVSGQEDHTVDDKTNGAIATMQECSALSEKEWLVAATMNENFHKTKPLVHWACFPTPSTTCIPNDKITGQNYRTVAQIQECCKSIFHVMQINMLVPGQKMHRMMNGGLCWKHKNYCRQRTQKQSKFFLEFLQQCRQEAAVVPQTLGTAEDATVSWVAYSPNHSLVNVEEPFQQLVTHITSTPKNEGADTRSTWHEGVTNPLRNAKVAENDNAEAPMIAKAHLQTWYRQQENVKDENSVLGSIHGTLHPLEVSSEWITELEIIQRQQQEQHPSSQVLWIRWSIQLFLPPDIRLKQSVSVCQAQVDQDNGNPSNMEAPAVECYLAEHHPSEPSRQTVQVLHVRVPLHRGAATASINFVLELVGPGPADQRHPPMYLPAPILHNILALQASSKDMDMDTAHYGAVSFHRNVEFSSWPQHILSLDTTDLENDTARLPGGDEL